MKCWPTETKREESSLELFNVLVDLLSCTPPRYELFLSWVKLAAASPTCVSGWHGDSLSGLCVTQQYSGTFPAVTSFRSGYITASYTS